MRVDILQKLANRVFDKQNQHDYAPLVTNPLAFDISWYTNLPKWIQDSLKQRFPDFQLTYIDYPHKSWMLDEDCYWDFYTWYNCELYDMSVYINLVEDAHIIPLNKKDKDYLKSLFKDQPEYNPYATWKQMKEINRQIEPILIKYQNEGCFVKLSQRSCKNDCGLSVARKCEDVYENLIHSQDIYQEIDDSSGIVLQKWKVIPRENEFRVFVLGRRIKGISQQYWNLPLRPVLDLSDFERATKDIKDIIKLIPYNDAVLDIFIDEQKVYLLEINPGCRWGASSSALFDWSELEEESKVINDKKENYDLMKRETNSLDKDNEEEKEMICDYEKLSLGNNKSEKESCNDINVAKSDDEQEDESYGDSEEDDSLDNNDDFCIRLYSGNL